MHLYPKYKWDTPQVLQTSLLTLTAAENMLPINMEMSEKVTTIMTNMSFLNLEGSTLPKSKKVGF